MYFIHKISSTPKKEKSRSRSRIVKFWSKLLISCLGTLTLKFLNLSLKIPWKYLEFSTEKIVRTLYNTNRGSAWYMWYPKKLSKTIEKGKNIALGCLRNNFTYSTNRRACTDRLRKLTINNKILFFVTESWGTEPTTSIDNSKTSIFKTNFMLHRRDPKHFGPQSITSPVGKRQSSTPRQCNCLPSLNTSSLFFTSLVLPMHFPLVQTKKMHCVHSLQELRLK